jgi:hypothetical protein
MSEPVSKPKEWKFKIIGVELGSDIIWNGNFNMDMSPDDSVYLNIVEFTKN